MWQLLVYASSTYGKALAVLKFGSREAADAAMQRVKDMDPGLRVVICPYTGS